MSRFPWRDTSEDIAGQSNSQWETPAGAQAKADKALQEAKQYTDEKNQDFTDHINNKTIHVTQADKDNWNSKAPGNHTHPNATQTQAGFESPEDKRKLDGIAAGAEVNQNAFSKVNDVEAQSKTDTVTLKGGTGITVSTNKATKEVTITATGEAIPGPHGSSHDHDGADPIPELVEIRERLEYTESEELTLQPGVQLVTAKRDARFKLGAIKGKTEINGQGRIGIIGVENPYVTRVSGNLLPPFYEWNIHPTAKIVDQYTLVQTATGSTQNTSVLIPVRAGETYTLSYPPTENSDVAYINIQWLDANGGSLGYSPKNVSGQTVTAPAGAMAARVLTGNTAAGTFTFKNPMLTVGSSSKPFTTREDSMLAFQTELHANPTDGSESDELFERDGQYFKLVKWKKRALDGSENWIHIGNKTGFKSLGVNSYALDAKKGDYEATLLATKFNGQKLKAGNSTDLSAEADIIYIYDGGLRISVANTDSGWGDNYTPTPDEIKAYFLGYKMYKAGQSGDTIFDGVGDKAWAYRRLDGTWQDVGTIPPTSTAPNWNPYNLMYKLASPLVEPVTSEGCLTLTEGDNQIEVGTGIILREGTQPKLSVLYNTYEINSVSTGNVALNPLRHKADKISAVYKNNHPDKWSRVSDTNSYGRERAFLDASLFDQTAPYSVTYIKLDKSPVVPITGSLALNEKARLTDLTAGIQEALQRVSVVEQKKAEKDQPVWIAPTLLNGWENFGGLYAPAGYMKDSQGFVHFRGLIRNGAVGQAMFVLPEGYRPKSDSIIGVISHNNTTYVPSAIKVTSTGQVIYLEGSLYHLPLECITPFLAEQ